MFFLGPIPFRSKNRPNAFPWVTVCLILANVIVYILTSESLLGIRESVVMEYGLIHNRFNLIRLFTHMFLHADLSHLIGNMMILWVFGGAVEGRMGWQLFLPFYLLVGLASGLCHDLVSGILTPEIPLVGASGAIMGVMGAFFWLAPYTQIVFWYFFWIFTRFRAGTFDLAAQWVILGYFVVDVVHGFAFRGTGAGGVANFAHLGGMVTGFLLLMMSGMKRESEEFAEAQAARSDLGGDFSIMSANELEPLVTGPNPDIQAVFIYCRKVLRDPNGYQRAGEVVAKQANTILQKGDLPSFAILILDIPPTTFRFPDRFLVALGEKLEEEGEYELAGRVFQHIAVGNENGVSAEMALSRYARLVEQTETDKGRAAAVYREMLRIFPMGAQANAAKNALGRLGATRWYYNAHTGQFSTDGSHGVLAKPVGQPNPAAEPNVAPEATPNPGFLPIAGGLGTVQAQAATPQPESPESSRQMPSIVLMPVGTPVQGQNNNGENQ
jgi:membrane associated rhomboid family serine protease